MTIYSNLVTHYPELQSLKDYRPILWLNPNYGMTTPQQFSLSDIEAAQQRLRRFSSYKFLICKARLNITFTLLFRVHYF